MHTAEWSLNRLTEVVNAIASSIYDGTPSPAGTDIVPPEGTDIGAALTAMASLLFYLASRVVVLSVVLEAFGSSTSIS